MSFASVCSPRRAGRGRLNSRSRWIAVPLGRRREGGAAHLVARQPNRSLQFQTFQKGSGLPGRVCAGSWPPSTASSSFLNSPTGEPTARQKSAGTLPAHAASGPAWPMRALRRFRWASTSPRKLGAKDAVHRRPPGQATAARRAGRPRLGAGRCRAPRSIRPLRPARDRRAGAQAGFQVLARRPLSRPRPARRAPPEPPVHRLHADLPRRRGATAPAPRDPVNEEYGHVQTQPLD